MHINQRIYPLRGKVQHYSWGGFDYIPQLLHLNNIDNKPFAEYWLGAHPNHPSTIKVNDKELSLNDFINEDKEEILGEETVEQFDSLPYLFKVLDVRQMLSIQVHPDKKSAKENFEKENSSGIPLSAPHRNYKDTNHKPELMVALGDFWLLHGFKPKTALLEVLGSVPNFSFLVTLFQGKGYEGMYREIMLMEQEKVNQILAPVVQKILPLYENGELQKSEEAFWVARAVSTFCKDGFYDRGIFSIYFFNLLHLKKGEGIYQPAGLPHAYLEGQNIEIMANSDNVLRAGLTDKHIDVPELLKFVQFKETNPQVISFNEDQTNRVYKSPAEEFVLSQQTAPAGLSLSFHTQSAEIIFVLEGELQLQEDHVQKKIKKGEAAFIVADTLVSATTQADTQFFKAAVPVTKNVNA